MKKFNRKTSEHSIVSSWLTVTNPSAMTSKCAKVIEKILNVKKLGFSDTYIEGNKKRYSLVGNHCVRISDIEVEGDIFAIPLNFLPYWLTMYMTFIQEKMHYKLITITIKIFRGMMTDIKEPCLRAEWHIPDENERVDHAQPHWHAYKTTIDIKSEFGYLSEKTREFEANIQKEKPIKNEAYPFDKFHFAMASKWHLNEGHQINLESETCLYNWIERCIKYIYDQIFYISGREGII